MVIRCQTQSATVPVLKKSAFGLMTDPAFSVRRSRKKGFFRKDNNAYRSDRQATPTLGPGHKVEAVLRPLRGRRTSNLHPSPTKI